MWSLIAVLLVLTPLAYADPPDPTWQVGVFDDGDFDEVIGFIISASGLAEVAVARCLRPDAACIVLRAPPLESSAAVVPLSAADPRAPPAL